MYSNRLRLGASLFAISLISLSSPAFAQAEDSAAENPESTEQVLVVTGSRIARPELQVANPIVAVTGEAIENTGKINVTDVLLRLPSLTSSSGSSLSGGADAGFGETGGNFLDLRNLGENRTLVLVNGKRHVAGVPNSAAVDINSIPQDLIEKVDVLTGGASAIYGADGVSGVVNFVLKRNFEGISARGQAGISSRGDAGTQFGSIVAGTNFADSKGNIAVAYEYDRSARLSPFARDFSGDPLKNFALLRNQADFPDDPAVFDRILYNNITWADSARDGAIDLDGDEIPDFTGSGLPYDRGLFLSSTGGRAIGGSNTPTAGYFGDLQPGTQRHSANLLSSFEFSPAFRVYGEAKYVQAKAFSVGQPSFDFFTTIASDNAFLANRFGAGAAPDGALLTRDNFDLGIRGESNKRETYRAVFGIEGELNENLKYDLSYVYGQTKASNTQTSNLIRDRYFAALDAVRDPATGNIVCRSTLDPTSNIDPNNFDQPASTFTPGANSICRPLNFFGENVASQAALDFVLADNTNRSKVTQNVVGGYLSGDFDSVFKMPGGGSLGFAVGAEYRREASSNTPDLLVQNGSLRDFAATLPSNGKFDVKEVFAELNAPLLSDLPFAHLLSASAAIRYSDYSTIGRATTWKVDGIFAPIRDIRFRGSYSQSVRAPNLGELFDPRSGTFDFVADPCDITRLDDGASTRRANCTALLSGLGLTPAQIATFSPATDAQNTTSRAGLSGGNPGLTAETARTWTVGGVIQPRFIPGLAITFDWYDITINDAVNTASATQIAELCVDQPTIDNRFCDSIFRAPGTGFVLGDSNDPAQRIGFIAGPENVANFKTSGADFSITYSTRKGSLGKFGFSLVGGYLDSIAFVPSIGAEPENDILEAYNPRWRGSFNVDWSLGKFSLNTGVNYFSKTRRFELTQIQANPDLSDPRFFFIKERWEVDTRASLDINDDFEMYLGVNNLLDEKPDFADLSYPVSGVGRFIYAGAKVKLGNIFR
jgi:iron complex outermembrane recepter protein